MIIASCFWLRCSIQPFEDISTIEGGHGLKPPTRIFWWKRISFSLGGDSVVEGDNMFDSTIFQPTFFLLQ